LDFFFPSPALSYAALAPSTQSFMFNVSNHAETNTVEPGTRHLKRVGLDTSRDAQPKQLFDTSAPIMQARKILLHAL